MSSHNKKVVPIETVELFPVLNKRLVKLLRSLKEDDWNKPTIAKLWKVKDMVAHLLDGYLRTLSYSRDQYFGQQPGDINSYADLINYLNQLNHSWTDATRRLSPKVLTDLLESNASQFYKHIKQLKPFDDAVFSVGWAGQQRSDNWFHIAREYTEQFLHQQQIRDAVGAEPLFSKKLYRPFLDTFMQALPHTYRDTNAEAGTVVTVIIESKAGGKWSISRNDNYWSFIKKSKREDAIVKIQPEDAWKLFSKGMSAEEALSNVSITGNHELGKKALQMVSVMA